MPLRMTPRPLPTTLLLSPSRSRMHRRKQKLTRKPLQERAPGVGARTRRRHHRQREIERDHACPGIAGGEFDGIARVMALSERSKVA